MTYQKLFKALAALLMLTILISISSVSFAAKKSYGVRVPASILNGSDITANRSFKVLGVKETSLGGLTLGQSGNKILQKYGNPTRVIVHRAPAETNNAMGAGAAMGGAMGAGAMGGAQMGGMPGMGAMGGAAMGGMPGMGGMDTGMGAMGGTMPGAMGGAAMGGMAGTMPGAMGGAQMGAMGGTMPGAMGGAAMGGMAGGAAMGGMPTAAGGARIGGATGMPGMPGAAGMGMAGAMGGAAQTGAVQAANTFIGTSDRVSDTTICWQYDLSSGVQLEFLVKNNKISQITVLSLYPWKHAKLKSGIMIGDTYKLTTYLWGIDYKQQAVGSFSRVTYFKNKGTAFIFLNKKLVGITIAAGEAII